MNDNPTQKGGYNQTQPDYNAMFNNNDVFSQQASGGFNTMSQGFNKPQSEQASGAFNNMSQGFNQPQSQQASGGFNSMPQGFNNPSQPMNDPFESAMFMQKQVEKQLMETNRILQNSSNYNNTSPYSVGPSEASSTSNPFGQGGFGSPDSKQFQQQYPTQQFQVAQTQNIGFNNNSSLAFGNNGFNNSAQNSPISPPLPNIVPFQQTGNGSVSSLVSSNNPFGAVSSSLHSTNMQPEANWGNFNQSMSPAFSNVSATSSGFKSSVQPGANFQTFPSANNPFAVPQGTNNHGDPSSFATTPFNPFGQQQQGQQQQFTPRPLGVNLNSNVGAPIVNGQPQMQPFMFGDSFTDGGQKRNQQPQMQAPNRFL
jgi:hypothetical protein